MRVMLYEPDNEGHRLTYARYVAEAVLQTGCETVLATSDYVPKSVEFKTQMAHLVDHIIIDPWITRGEITSERPNPFRGLAHTAFLVQESIRRTQPDHVLVIMADGVSQGMGYKPRCIPTGMEIEGLFMRGRWAYPSRTLKGKFRTFVSLRLTSRAPWTRLFHLDELAAAALQKRGGHLAKISEFMPHAIEPPASIPADQARASFSLDPTGIYFACLGALTDRKGIQPLLQALQTTACPPEVKLLLVGKCAPNLTALMNSEPIQKLIAAGRIVLINRYVTDQELACAYAAANCVLTLYSDTDLPASIVLNAASYAKPVLGSNTGWIGHIIRQNHLGWTCNPQNPADIAAALAAALPLLSRYETSPESRKLVASHSVDAFKAKWTERIRQRLASPSHAGA